MPLLAGYFAQSKCEPHVLSAAVEGFQVTSTYKVDGKQSASRIIETKYGHQLVHSSPNAISQPTVVQDNNGNSLTLLGFVRPTSASLLLDSAVHKGATSLEHLEGQFVVVFCDTESGAVHVVNDRFGSRPFYFLQAGDKTYYASSLRFLFRLAGIRPSPDPVGWLQIFTYWHTFGQRTNRLGALRLRPASHVTISLGGLDERQYWQLTHEPGDLDLQAHADATFEAFEESAAWRARRFRRCLIALSGGLDSRMVAAAHPNDVDAVAFTLVTAPNGQNDLEANTAAKVAACLQLPHEISRIKLGNYSSVIDDVVLLTEGLMPMHHPAKTMHFLERMSDGYNYLLGGGPGDVLAGAYIPSAVYLDPARAEVLRDEFYEARQQLAAYLGLIFSPDWLTEYRHVIRDSFLETWEVLKGPTAAHRATAWGMLIRQPAFTFSGPLHNHPYFDEGTAHLGYKYTDLMLRLPAHWLYQRNFYKYMVHRCIPKLREVVYSNTGQKLSGHLDNLTAPPWHPYREWFSKRLHRSLLLAKSFPPARAMKRALLGAPKPDFDYWILSGDTKLLEEVEELLDLANLPPFLDRRRCRTFIHRFRQGVRTSADSHLFGCLAAACVTAKYDG